ncbi:hypothetical protein BAE46_01700 [Glaciecola punicea]|jgi:KipI family sensor histidine kinase inhibitor|nr:hypothetical protein BAE46_01700 [Glaciecola punicea]
MFELEKDQGYQYMHNAVPLDEYSHVERVSEVSIIIRVNEKSRTCAKRPALSLQARNARVKRCLALIKAKSPKWLIDHVVSYDSLLLVYDAQDIRYDIVLRFLLSTLAELKEPEKKKSHAKKTEKEIGHVHQIDVCYELNNKSQPSDMSAVEEYTNLTSRDIVNLHQSIQYQVFAIGFMPNFAYLGELSPLLRMPRLAHPRLAVPAGAVAIAGQQTAVYPSISPGGWHIIGYTAFSFSDDATVAMGPEDKVIFKAIDQHEYDRQLKQAEK